MNLDDRKIDFVMVEEPLQISGKNAKQAVRKMAEIKKEKAKSAERHENAKRTRTTANPPRAAVPSPATEDRARRLATRPRALNEY